jgi:hypothetical protein
LPLSVLSRKNDRNKPVLFWLFVLLCRFTLHQWLTFFFQQQLKNVGGQYSFCGYRRLETKNMFFSDCLRLCKNQVLLLFWFSFEPQIKTFSKGIRTHTIEQFFFDVKRELLPDHWSPQRTNSDWSLNADTTVNS